MRTRTNAVSAVVGSSGFPANGLLLPPALGGNRRLGSTIVEPSLDTVSRLPACSPPEHREPLDVLDLVKTSG